MQAFVFSFDFDSSGSPDPVILPEDFPSGKRRIVLKPPIGHSWSFYGPSSAEYELGTDEALSLTRDSQSGFQAGETIGRAELDTGSGTGKGIAP